MATLTPLRRRMIEDMTLRNLSRHTQQSYVYAVAHFSRHFKTQPGQARPGASPCLSAHLISQKRSWTHVNQVTCALRFFFCVTLGRKDAIQRIIAAREPTKLPPVLSAEEVARFLEAVPDLRNRVALATAYAAGLGVCEVSRLKPGSIDSKRVLTFIESGKDRYLMLSPRLLGITGLPAHIADRGPGLGCKMKAICASLNFERFMDFPFLSPAAKVENSNPIRSSLREVDHLASH